MRPRIGKVPHWDKVTPTEQKKIDKVAKKWVLIKWLHQWKDTAYWETQEKWVYQIQEDSHNLRGNVEMHPTAGVVMEKLNYHDAQMWLKMME